MSTSIPRVLIVENDDLCVTQLRDSLTRLAYTVCGPVPSGEMILQDIAVHQPDVVLMGMDLAGKLTGVEAAALLWEKTDVPVIFITTHSEPEPFRQLCGLEPFGYLLRPFDDLELHATIRMALHMRRMGRALRKVNEWLEEKVSERMPEPAAEHLPLKQMENVNIATDGRGVVLETSASPLFDREGRFQNRRGIDRDITERKQSEQLQARLTAILEATPDFVGTATPDGRGIYLNRSGRRMLGIGEEEDLSGLLITETHAEWARRIVLEEGIPTAVREGVWMGETALLDRDGREIPVSQVILAHKGTSGKVEFISTIARDITGRKRAEAERVKLQAQFTQAQKMESVGRLAGGVAHDFNNMLTVILGNADLAMLSIDSSDKIYENLCEIRRAAQSSIEITRQLLGFARKQTVAPEKLNLNDVVTRSLKMLKRLIGEDIHLAWLPQHDAGCVKVDPSQIDQILANLAVNARDAIAGEGRITVETANVTLDEAYCSMHMGFVPGAYVMLAMSDNGCGMDREVLDHTFEPFFTTKEAGKGTGLGLATVYGIVKQNQGFINVYSEVGEGTTVKIYLPLCTEETMETRVTNEAETTESRGETVLLVEDETAILALIQSTLERLGYKVLTATGPADAIGQAEAHAGEIDILMTDVVMPGMNGPELTERLRAIRPGLKCLYISGYPAKAISHRGVLEEGVHFLEKPFTIKDLAPKLRAALDSK